MARLGTALAGVLVAVLLAGCLAPSGQQTGQQGRTASVTAMASTTAGEGSAGGRDARSGLPFVAASSLPAEARTTLALIRSGGPFPWAQDGSVFGNFERILPARPRGHYREYTVRTPAESDRGARRIVAGADGERYWTADHYATFRAVREDR